MDVARDAPLIALLVVAFLLALILAAAETALVRTPAARAASLAEDGHRRGRRVQRLVERLPEVLNAILLSALLAQITSATVTGVLAERWFGSVGVTVASIVLTVVLFVYAEALPKTYAVRHPDRVVLALAGPISVLERLLRPVVSLLVGFADLQMPGKGIATSPTVTEVELRYLASRAAREGEITEQDLELIERVFRFGDRTAVDVMVPRTDIVAVPSSCSVDEALQLALEAGHRRVPVYEGSVENIVGIVRLRDLVHPTGRRAEGTVRRLAEQPLDVPETKRVVELLRDMQRSHTHVAVVVDEYGGTAGLVTVEDIVEEMLGTITEEEAAPPVVEVGERSWTIDASLGVSDLSELLDVRLPDGEWNTAAGLVMGLTGRVPAVGDEVEVPEYTLRVASVRRRRITRITIRPRA